MSQMVGVNDSNPMNARHLWTDITELIDYASVKLSSPEKVKKKFESFVYALE